MERPPAKFRARSLSSDARSRPVRFGRELVRPGRAVARSMRHLREICVRLARDPRGQSEIMLRCRASYASLVFARARARAQTAPDARRRPPRWPLPLRRCGATHQAPDRAAAQHGFTVLYFLCACGLFVSAALRRPVMKTHFSHLSHAMGHARYRTQHEGGEGGSGSH